MTVRRAVLDSVVALYALGKDHPLREPCRAVLHRAAQGSLELHASWELVQEVLFHRMRRTDRVSAVEQTRSVSVQLTLHDLDREIMEKSMDLILSTEIRGRDALHAATALQLGMPAIISTDHAFDQVPGLTRIDPTDFDA